MSDYDSVTLTFRRRLVFNCCFQDTWHFTR